MMNTAIECTFIIGSYLLGSFPYALLRSRARGFKIAPGEDYHIAVWRRISRLEGLSGIAVDVLKGVIPIVIGFVLDFRLIIIVIAGVAAVIGQMWPVFQKFNGEKGNTTGVGTMITLCLFSGGGAIIALGAGLTCFLIGFMVRTVPRFLVKSQTFNERLSFDGPASNSLPLGMLCGFAITPLISWFLKQPLELTLALTAVFLAIVIRRLTANLIADLKTAKTSAYKILINRLFFDRSYF